MVEAKPGARFRSAVCEAEAVVVRAPTGDLDLRFGGQPAVPVGHPPPEALAVTPGFDTGCLIGKRYTNASGDLEVLCTKPGPSSLSLGDDQLELKDAKPLPSSD